MVLKRVLRNIGHKSMVSQFLTVETRKPPNRQGAVSIWAIVCLLLVTVMGATLGRLALMGSRHMIQERRHSQAEWLLQSGWSLASTRLQASPEYKGETWEISAVELGGADAGRVKIEVSPSTSGAPPEQRDVYVIAEFPVQSNHRIQLTRRGTLRHAKP